MTVAYQVDPRLQLGLEYNPAVGEIGPTVNWLLSPETARSPLVSFGTSSDRIGTPRDQRAYYVTFAKRLDETFAPYVSLNYSEYDDRLNVPFGANIFIGDRWVLLPMFDGRKSHLLLTYRERSTSVSLIWVWYRHPGIAVSWGF